MSAGGGLRNMSERRYVGEGFGDALQVEVDGE
jgi:hypothetical protein